VQYADRVVHVPGDGTVEYGDPDELYALVRMLQAAAPAGGGERPSIAIA